MPPKPEKTKELEEPVGYNLNLMSLRQLKCYARLLEGEIEDMRKHCNFYQKTEDELVEMLRVAEDELRSNEYEIISKDAKLERLKHDFLSHLKEKKQWPEYMEHKSAINREELLSNTEIALKEEENRHLENTERLQSLLLERDRELESLRVRIEMARIETQENNKDDLMRMEDEEKRLLDASLKRFESAIHETERDFLRAKEQIVCEAQETRIMGERDLNTACEGFKRKLQMYYQEVTRQDLETIGKLKDTIKQVEESIRLSKQSLREACSQNVLLKTDAKVRQTRLVDPSSKFDAKPLRVAAALEVHNKVEKLALENQNLEAEIKTKMDQINSLRLRFTLALNQVRESAEKKVAILQRKLDFIMEEREQAKSSMATLESSSLEQSSTDISAAPESEGSSK